MDRNAFHDQIAMLAEKILHLNELLSQEQTMHPVEVELLLGYERELRSAIEKMSVSLGSIQAEERSHGVEQADESEKEGIRLQQHISGQRERQPRIATEEVQVEPMVPPVAPRDNKPLVKMQQPAGEADKKPVALHERFRKETTSLSEKLKGAKKKNMKELFDLNERYKFIESLFGGSTEQFNKALSDLGKMTDRTEAGRYIETISSKYSWVNKPELATRFSGQVLETIES